MANYTNKKTNVKKFMFAALDYIPGKLVYITNIDKNTIYFLGFFSQNKECFRSHNHNISKKCIKDFKTIPEGFNAGKKVNNIVNNL